MKIKRYLQEREKETRYNGDKIDVDGFIVAASAVSI